MIQNRGRSSEESYGRDFDDGANDLWSLYEKEAKKDDEALIKPLKDDMDGVLIFAGLFSGVLAAFVVPQIQNLRVNPADQSVYYQNQSVQMLDRISQQLASVGSQISTNITAPSPYPTFHARSSDRRVNIFWLISLICSLSAALLATLVQQWVRSYIRKSSNPLKTARIRLYLFEGTERIPMVAEAVPGLIHVSLILFFWGLGDLILHIDTPVFVVTVVPVVVCVCLYLYCVVAPIWNPQSPYRTPFSGIIWHLIRKLHRSPYYSRFRGKVVEVASMAERQEQFAMKETEGRLGRDVRAIQWLVDNINGSNEMQTFVLAIPGSFNQEWGRDVWKEVVRDDQSTSAVDPQTQLLPGLPSPREQTTVSNLCRCLRYFFETFSNEGDFMGTEERRRLVHGCVETAASLVCCTELELGLLGKVEEVLSALGSKERTNDPLTIISNPSFSVRWTCLSLVAIWKSLDCQRIQFSASLALERIARIPPDYCTTVLTAAQRIDGYLEKAWDAVADIYMAFEPWSQDLTDSEIKEILNSQKASILKLERIADEAVGLEYVDERISALQNAMDVVTNKLMRRLPGVCFSELKPATPVMINEVFNCFSSMTADVPPQLIFPGQQIQSLYTLGQRLRNIIEGQDTEKHEETFRSLESINSIPSELRGQSYSMKRQIWRLLDLRDGGGLGFTIELFLITIAQLSSTSTSAFELKKAFYTGTFKVITSDWKKSKNSAGTQRILLELLCDLVTPLRGAISAHSYPPYIMEMFLELVKDMVEGHAGKHPHINDVIHELEDETLWRGMNSQLRVKALSAIVSSSEDHDEDSNPVHGVALSDPEAEEGGPVLRRGALRGVTDRIRTISLVPV